MLSVEMGKTEGRFDFGEKIKHVDFEVSIRHPSRGTSRHLAFGKQVKAGNINLEVISIQPVL